MKILVLSDSHNVIINSQIEEIKKQGEFDLLIHCGDNYKDAAKFAQRLEIENVLNVPGNCDYGMEDRKSILIEEIEGKKFIITHGHLHGVKYSIDKLKDYAIKNKAEVVLYGHSHRAQNEVIDGILFFNPGSTIFPKDGQTSFGILDLSQDNIKSYILPL
ncbi:MAG: metallophosphoesterase [Tissierellia bacterium]|nr:metallophosphoesterase [Tissierellia bacterium]